VRLVKIDQLTIGAGRPKMIVPIVGQTKEEILAVAKEASESVCDLVEWRIDHYEDVTVDGAVSELSKVVKEIAGKPLLVTFRSFKEGGELDIPDDQYFNIYHDIITNGQLDLLDIELFMDKDQVAELVAACHDKNIQVVMCNHDFDATPSKEEIVSRLEQMEEKGADICKIAVMPKNASDVLVLLDATQERYQQADVPLITMSMGSLGMVSRLAGEAFGSAATFGSLGKASAPGQMPVEDLATSLERLQLS